jgi:hypothetical protein
MWWRGMGLRGFSLAGVGLRLVDVGVIGGGTDVRLQ